MRLSCLSVLLFSTLLSAEQPLSTPVQVVNSAAESIPETRSAETTQTSLPETDEALNSLNAPLPALATEPLVLPISKPELPMLPPADYDVMLLGGGMPICSSLAPAHCAEEASFSALAKTQLRYALDPSQLQLLAAAPIFSSERQALQQQVVALLSLLQTTFNGEFTATELTTLWRALPAQPESDALSGEALWQALSEREHKAILDYLEVATFSADRQYRLTEQADLANSLDQQAVALYQQLVSLATAKATSKGRSQAKVLLITAAASDPFASVDLYLDIFRQAGAEVAWLPLNAALTRALSSKNCAALADAFAEQHGRYRREQVYADRFAYQQQLCQKGENELIKHIQQADALFFSDGDVTLLTAALRQADGTATAALNAILAALQQNSLLLAANNNAAAALSGGQLFATAPIPMLSSGDSYHALQYGAKAAAAPWQGCQKEQRCPNNSSERQLTYATDGGLGLFPLGIVDTQFAERGRQARLLVLQQASQSRFGFGIDENTALLVDLSQWSEAKAQLTVVGSGDVTLSVLQPESTPNVLLASHYLLSAGDTMLWQTTEPQLFPANDKMALTQLAEPLRSKSPIFTRSHFREFSRSLCRSNLISASISEPPYTIKLTKQDNCYQAETGKLSYRQLFRIINPD
ncbi:hypothetical protein LMJ53_12410 [Rheinheimera sp. UJ51]|uniref:hypothetical protein n=1 Tax=Rheinheimera sp. UJ51 TaxID=2892446 RepID=UPI001E44E722|nr:hypothetical protein [Rheinheimera sp. UJ51]MCC5452523.1 hypothetical protein [Rheinheimera sp. UJ51]